MREPLSRSNFVQKRNRFSKHELTLGCVNAHSNNHFGKDSTLYKKFTGAAIVLAVVVGMSASAQAGRVFKLNPENSSFTATGDGTVSENGAFFACTVNMSGTTDKTTGSITGLTFSGQPGCENVLASGLPWKFEPRSLKQIQIKHLDLTYPGLGRCGPDKVNARISTNTLSIHTHLPNSRGVCKISADLTLSPALSITEK